MDLRLFMMIPVLMQVTPPMDSTGSQVIKVLRNSFIFIVFFPLKIGSVVKTVSPGNVMAVSLPTVPGVTVSLPTLSSTHQLVTLPNLNTIQPGQSLLANNIRVQPGQSLLLSEPMRKKMKF